MTASRRREWVYRLVTMTAVPALFFVLLEGGLRLTGFGYPAAFFAKVSEGDTFTANQRFGWRFFPPSLARAPSAFRLDAEKDEGAYRIFILGGSAAWGTPGPSFGFARILEVMLRNAFPEVRFEVINTAMVAVNSHVVFPIARECARHDPDLFIVYLGNNEVVGPFGAGTVFGSYTPNLFLIRANVWARSLRTGQLVKWVLERILHRESRDATWGGMQMFLEQRVAADDPRLEGVYRHYRRNIADISQAGTRGGARVILSTVGTNLRDCPPFASLHRTGLSEAALAAWNRLYERGKSLEEEGRHAEAVEAYRETAAIDDAYAELHFRLARILLAVGDASRAREHYQRALDLDALRFRADTRINEIIREVAGSQKGEGVRLADAELALAQSPEAEHGIPGEGLFYEHVHLNFVGNYRVAETLFREVVEILPPRILAASAVTTARADIPPLSQMEVVQQLALTGWNRYKMAKDTAALASVPPFTNQLEHDERQRRREATAAELKKFTSPRGLESAAQLYEQAIEHWPEDLQLRFYFALLLQTMGQMERAIQQWRILLDRAPDVAEARMNLGLILLKEGKETEAEEQFAAAIAIDPHFAVDVCRMAARMLTASGRLDEAAAFYARLLERHPAAIEGQLELGEVLSRQGKMDEALAAYREAVRIAPENPDAWVKLGRLQYARGEVIEAVAAFRKTLEIRPGYGALPLILAWTLATHPDPNVRSGAEAVRLAEAAISEADEESAGALDCLAAAYAEAGRYADAVATAERALVLAGPRSQSGSAAAIEARLALYRQGKPFRESGSAEGGGH